jgi:hypothetical protein
VGGRVSDGEVGYDVRLSLNSPDLLALGCGRSDADPGAAVLDGDVALGQRVVGCLGVTP